MHSDHDLPPSSGTLHATGHAAFSGIEAIILLGGERAPMTVMSMHVSPGQGAPAHISYGEDKVFQIASGNLLFLVGEGRTTVSAGDHVFVERGLVHGFVALGDAPANMTLVATPARHDRFFMAMGALPLPHDLEGVGEICRRFDQAIVGPVIATDTGTMVRLTPSPTSNDHLMVR